MKKNGVIKQSYIEPGSLWQNTSEREIGENKKAILKAMEQTNASRRVWDFASEHVAQLRSQTLRDKYPMLQWIPQIEVIVQDTLDISELSQFSWYEPVWC